MTLHAPGTWVIRQCVHGCGTFQLPAAHRPGTAGHLHLTRLRRLPPLPHWQGSVWPQLQISSDVHCAVFAWVHYRQVRWQGVYIVSSGMVQYPQMGAVPSGVQCTSNSRGRQQGSCRATPRGTWAGELWACPGRHTPSGPACRQHCCVASRGRGGLCQLHHVCMSRYSPPGILTPACSLR